MESLVGRRLEGTGVVPRKSRSISLALFRPRCIATPQKTPGIRRRRAWNESDLEPMLQDLRRTTLRIAELVLDRSWRVSYE